MHAEARHHKRVSGGITGDIRVNSKSFTCQDIRTNSLETKFQV